MFKMNLKVNDNIYKKLKILYLVLWGILIFCSPGLHIESIKDICTDATIQTKIGLDSIAQGSPVITEIYSWHEGLKWTPHELGWYLILGFIYSNFGVTGEIIFNVILNGVLGFIVIREIKNNRIIGVTISLILLYLSQFPYYNCRPHILSIPLFFLCYTLFKDSKKIKRNSIAFISIVWVVSIFHGGTLPIFFLLAGVQFILYMLYKEYKFALIMGVSIGCAFGISLINPVGIEVWLYGIKQSKSEIWSMIQEWQPMSLGIAYSFIIALLCMMLIFCKFTLKDRNVLYTGAVTSMFFIGTLMYARFFIYFMIMLTMIIPKILDRFVIELNNAEFSIKELKINKFFIFMKQLEIKVGLVFLSCIVAFFWGLYGMKEIGDVIKSNTMQDIFDINNIDIGVVSTIKENNYNRVYNSYNDGSWLIFNDILVNIDNRCDPYLKESSVQDYIVFNPTIENLLKSINEGKADVILLQRNINEDKTDFLNYLDRSEEYKKVYDNVVNETEWLLYETPFARG